MSQRFSKCVAFTFVCLIFFSCSSFPKNHDPAAPIASPSPVALWKCQANVQNMKFDGSGATLMTAQIQAKKACVSRFTEDLCDDLMCVVAP